MLPNTLPSDALAKTFSYLFVDALASLQASSKSLALFVQHTATSAWSEALLFTSARLRDLLSRYGQAMGTNITNRQSSDWLASEYTSALRLLARVDEEPARRLRSQLKSDGLFPWLSTMIRQRRLALATASRVCLLGERGQIPLASTEGCQHILTLDRTARGADPVVSNIKKFLNAGQETPKQSFNQRLRLARRAVIAAAVGDYEDLLLVLSPPLGADPDASLCFEGLTTTALGLNACRWGHLHCARILVRFGADANCLPSPDVPSSLAVSRPAVSGWQLPLHIASTNGHLDVVKYLVQRAGANPCAVDNKGQTAAMCAQEVGEMDCYAFLAPVDDIAATQARAQTQTSLLKAEVAGLEAARSFLGTFEELSDDEAD